MRYEILANSVGKKLVLMAATLVSSIASLTMDPARWLSEACAQQGLHPRRINFDIQPESNQKERATPTRVALFGEKMNNSEVNVQRLSNLEDALFNRAKSKDK